MKKTVPILLFVAIILPFMAGCGGNINEDEPDIPVPPPPEPKEDIRFGTGFPEINLTWLEEGGYEISFKTDGAVFKPYEAAICIEVFPENLQTSSHIYASYSNATINGNKLICTGALSSKEGSGFEVEDTYSIEDETISLSRSISVKTFTGADYAYNSYFLLKDASGGSISGYEYLLPSLIYKSSENLTGHSIGSNLNDDWILAREDRMGLPFTMFRNTASGVSASITDFNLNPSTVDSDFGLSHMVNGDFSYGSLGYFNRMGYPVLAYCYPGSEGQRTYSDGGGASSSRWARRSHPIRTNCRHEYCLKIQFSKSEDFPESVKYHWRKAFDAYQPEIADIDIEDILNYNLELLDHYWMEDNDAPGFPFSVDLRTGNVKEISYDMGFVGMQIPCAYYLYRNGLETGNASHLKKGEEILDFWAGTCLNEVGMPQVWWDISPWNFFRNSNDLRNMQGGMEGLILAWKQAEKYNPGSKPAWLDCCVRAADWMISVQHPDGSLDKAYDKYGNSIDSGKMLTSNIIRFLSYMYEATGDEKYKEAAFKAGEFCLETIHSQYKYVGSVIDNPNIKDRESGQKMLEASLSLYDLSGEKRWLDAAVQAAYYTVTYMYAWNIPQPPGNNYMSWTRKRNTTGITIIATGHSGADAGFAYNSFEYFRLYELTGDEYLLKIAEILEKNTKQTMNYDGALGYAFRGLQTEALRLVTHWGDNVNLWLPWLTAAHLDPIYKFRDNYGKTEIKDIK